MNDLRCALIFLGPFPVGNVSTLRILSYCKALANKGVFVKVLIIAPTTEAQVNKDRFGSIDGVEYQYMTGITWRKLGKFRLIKYLYYIIGLLISLKYLNKDRINCVLSYHDELVSNVFYRVFASLFSIPYILDKTEYPKDRSSKSKFRREVARYRLKLFSGIITITSELKEFYSRILTPERVFLLPMTIDINRFQNTEVQEISDPYIAVIFGTHNRDGLEVSVKAYGEYCRLSDAPPFKLKLVGDFNTLCQRWPRTELIKRYIEDNNLGSLIEIIGLVPINDVPQLLINAACLMTTPANYASGGFPTKLGEYLLAGVPVIATSAGEISNYLTDEINILLSPTNNVNHIARRILFVQNNPKAAQKIALAGKALAIEVFNAETYSWKLIKFIKGIK